MSLEEKIGILVDETAERISIGQYGNNYTTMLSNASIAIEIITLNPDFTQRETYLRSAIRITQRQTVHFTHRRRGLHDDRSPLETSLFSFENEASFLRTLLTRLFLDAVPSCSFSFTPPLSSSPVLHSHFLRPSLQPLSFIIFHPTRTERDPISRNRRVYYVEDHFCNLKTRLISFLSFCQPRLPSPTFSPPSIQLLTYRPRSLAIHGNLSSRMSCSLFLSTSRPVATPRFSPF